MRRTGESFAALCQRLADWLAAFDRPGDWLAVTHPMVMRAVLVQVLGCPMKASQRIDVLPCHAWIWALPGSGACAWNEAQNASL